MKAKTRAPLSDLCVWFLFSNSVSGVDRLTCWAFCAGKSVLRPERACKVRCSRPEPADCTENALGSCATSSRRSRDPQLRPGHGGQMASSDAPAPSGVLRLAWAAWPRRPPREEHGGFWHFLRWSHSERWRLPRARTRGRYPSLQICGGGHFRPCLLGDESVVL